MDFTAQMTLIVYLSEFVERILKAWLRSFPASRAHIVLENQALQILRMRQMLPNALSEQVERCKRLKIVVSLQ